MILLAVSMIMLCSTPFSPNLSSSLYISPILLYQLHDKRDTYKFKDELTSEIPRDSFFSPLCTTSRKTFQELLHAEN